MGVLDTVSSALSDRNESSDDGASASRGAYWCDDCNVRVLDVEVDERGLARNDGTPVCPECGDEMRFERSHADGCAC